MMRTPSNPPSRPPDNAGEIPANRTHVDDAIRWIHLIDDDADLGAALKAGLESRGYRTTYSNSADSAWIAAHNQFPDLILCDINMPGKNGYRFLQEIRKDSDLGNCQFVFMTGNPIFAQTRAAMDLGADDFLLKPFTLDTLADCVAARLRRSHISGHSEAGLVRTLRESLHSGLPHEFFTPLTGIMGYAELLEQDGENMKPAEIKEALGNILHSGRRLQRTLRNYLYALDRLNPDSTAPFPVLSAASVVQLIQQGALTAAQRHARKADLMLDIRGAPLLGGAQELSLLAEELAENAFSFSKPGSPVQIRMTRESATLHLMVTDAGRGMSRLQLKNLGLFRQFERSKYEQQGLGVGLFIVQQILRRLRGRLHLESSLGSGTTAQVMLPVHSEVART